MNQETRKRARNVSSQFPQDRQGYCPPRGVLKAQFHEAHEAGCLQAEEDSLAFKERFDMLMRAMMANLCDSCPIWTQDGPACECFQKYHTAMTHCERAVGAERQKTYFKTVERCSICGFKIKGANHQSGKHHQEALARQGAN